MKRLFLFAFLSLILIGCGISTEDSYCPYDLTNESIDQLTLLHDAFIDSYNVAGATGRAYLAPPVLAMQETKQKVSALDVPLCLEKAKNDLITGMEYSINGYLAFMKEEGNIAVNEEFENGDKFIDFFYSDISKIRGCLPDCVED